jgi:putative addiction module component (TIGR02574 family)
MFPMMQQYGIDKLSDEEKLGLVEEIWESMEEPVKGIPLTETQKQELDRRVAHYEAHPESALTWDELKQRVRAKR